MESSILLRVPVEIPLRQRDGRVAAIALVDDEDADLATERWHLSSRGYAQRQVYKGRVDGRDIRELELMHRRVMHLRRGDALQVDHINRDKLDNRRANLRLVTQAANNLNVDGGYGRSRVRGVHWRADRGKWFVRLTINRKQHLGGSFANVEDAERAAIAMRERLLGSS